MKDSNFTHAKNLNLSCVLCLSASLKTFTVNKIVFYSCPNCELVFKSSQHAPDLKAQREVYELHENNPTDAGYRDFLMRAITPLMAHLPKTAQGLDFGCGPGPTTSKILNEHGFECLDYDPIFFNNPELLEQQYDFIIATEVIEHFLNPKLEFHLLDQLLRPNGLLCLMTMWIPPTDFALWHYHRDPTHMVFYSANTIKWVAKNLHFDVLHLENNVAVLKKAR